MSTLNDNGFDNTGLRLNISEKGTDVFVTPVGSPGGSNLHIKLPNTVALSVKNSGWPISTPGKTIALDKIKSEVEISTQFDNFKLTHIAGPLSIKTLNGNIELQLEKTFKGPISVYTLSGFIDITVPENAKADLTMNTMSGTIYADESLKLASGPVKENKPEFEMLGHSLNLWADTIKTGVDITVPGFTIEKDTVNSIIKKRAKVQHKTVFSLSYPGISSSFNGTLNGGGQKIKLQTTNGKIYLRK